MNQPTPDPKIIPDFEASVQMPKSQAASPASKFEQKEFATPPQVHSQQSLGSTAVWIVIAALIAAMIGVASLLSHNITSSENRQREDLNEVERDLDVTQKDVEKMKGDLKLINYKLDQVLGNSEP